MRSSRYALLAALLAACAAPATQPPPGPEPHPPVEATGLPPIPPVDGPLRIDVVYPEPDQAIASDSTFIFGSVGSGRATLTIDGAAVDVAPNGAFVAYLSVPADGVYRFQATKAAERADAEVRVRVPSTAVAPAPPGAHIVEGSVYPSGAWAAPPGELITVGFRGTPGGQASLLLPDGNRIPLVEQRAAMNAGSAARNFQRESTGAAAIPPRFSRYAGSLPATPLVARDTSVEWPLVGRLVPRIVTATTPADTATDRPSGAVFELVAAGDTARLPLRLNLAILDPTSPRIGQAAAPADAPHDWTLRGRPYTSGPYHYFWPDGTKLRITGERNGMFRARLKDDLSAWVPAADVRLLPTGTPPPEALIEGVRFTHYPGYIELRIPTGERLPFMIHEDDRRIDVDVFGATSVTNFFQYGGLDPLIERAEWSQPADGVYRVSVHMSERVWGYEPYFASDGDLIVRIRRPPEIDPEHPLNGLLIAVDAGHPPGGAIGPTRLTEAEANLAIALELKPMLEAAGARVLMTRTTDAAVELNSRPRMAADSGADVLISIHNNAFPDGVNPFVNNGTSAYYFHPHSAALATELQRALLDALGLRDLGIGRADLALVRPTWMPAVLTETSFLMMPRQEAALRDPAVQERIARAHLEGLEAFLHQRAGR